MSHLYKKFVKERVTDLVSIKKNIRNVTIIAHIDTRMPMTSPADLRLWIRRRSSRTEE